MSLSQAEIILAKPEFISRYNAKREMICRDKNLESYYDRVLEQQDLSLNAQFNKMFSIDGKTANLIINGGMSEQGPDWIDVYLGYGGTSYANIRRAIDEAISSKVEKINITMNTGGGNIDYLEQTADKIKEAVNLGIEVTVYNAGMIASAGVWLAASASKIYSVAKTATIGSIGVVVEGLDFSEYYKRMGVETVTIVNTDSPNKRLDLTTDNGKSILRKELDDIAGIFFEHVASNRNISIDVLKELKGTMIISADAESIGLMDSKEKADHNRGGDKKRNLNKKPNTEKKMTEEEMKALSASIGTAVAEAVKPLNEKITALESSIVADKEAAEQEKSRVASFASLSVKYPEQSAMINEEIKKGASCSSDFTLSVVEAEMARKLEADNLAENADTKAPKIDADKKETGSKKGLLDGVNRSLRGK